MFSALIEKLQRKKQISLLTKHRNSKIGSLKIGINNHFTLYPDLKSIAFGNSINLRNYIHIIVGKNAVLELGNNVFMNNFCSINCLDHVSIGENTLFGENVKLYDHNHAYKRDENCLTVSHSEFTKASIKIGKNCWLGSNVTVLKGVTIGDNCIIGAGCVISKSIPENTTVINKQNLTSEIN